MALGTEESQVPHAAWGLRLLLRSRLPVLPWAALPSGTSLWLARRTDSDCFASVHAGTAPVRRQWVWARPRSLQKKETLFSSLKTWAFHEGVIKKNIQAHTPHIIPMIKTMMLLRVIGLKEQNDEHTHHGSMF